jgi:O-antigen/teichoic acid export membrane protein
MSVFYYVKNYCWGNVVSKASEIAKTSTKGSFHYLWGLILSTAISAIGTIFIARLLGSDQYGLYTIVLAAPSLIVTFRDWGINSAMIKFTAQYRAEERKTEIRSIFLTGIIFEIILGLALSVLSFALSGFLATSLYNRPNIAPLIEICSFSILAGALITGATAAFTGFEKMELNSIMIVFHSIFKTALIVVLVLFGLGASGAITGFILSTFIGGLIGIALVWKLYASLPKTTGGTLQIKAYLITMLTYALPLSFAAILSSLLPHFYSFLLPIHYTTDNTMIGNYGIANNFVVLISFFALPITAMVFPAFSKLHPIKDKEALRSVFQFSVKYASLFVVPVTALVMCLAVPAVSTLFGDTYSAAPLFLALLAAQYLFTTFGSLSIGGLLSGQGDTSFILKMAIMTIAVGFPVGYIGIIYFGVLGLIITSLIAGMPALLWGLWFVRKTYGVSVDWVSSAKILVASAIAGLVTFGAISLLDFSSFVELVFGVVIFMIILVPSALIVRAVSRSDIANLRGMVGGLGAIGRLFSRLLGILEKIMDAFNF